MFFLHRFRYSFILEREPQTGFRTLRSRSTVLVFIPYLSKMVVEFTDFEIPIRFEFCDFGKARTCSM